jgi:hypothetical protein
MLLWIMVKKPKEQWLDIGKSKKNIRIRKSIIEIRIKIKIDSINKIIRIIITILLCRVMINGKIIKQTFY